MKKILRLLTRAILVLPALALQVLWYILLITWLDSYSHYIHAFMLIAETLVVLDILSQRGELKYRLLWIIVVLLFPVLGIWLYFLSGNRRSSKPILKRIKKNNSGSPLELDNYLEDDFDDKSTYQTFYMVRNLSQMPIKKAESTKYYNIGEAMYEDMLEELKKAEHFIFIEYFIIERGRFWDSIVEILKQKVAEGVTVKVMFDDIGSISTYSISGWKKLSKLGIDVVSFNPLTFLKFTLNNRDHRKIMVIDNRVCFSGGVNIADEYINEKNRFGHWKDIGFKLEGEAVSSYTLMFTRFWNAYSKNKIRFDDYNLKFDSSQPENEFADSGNAFTNFVSKQIQNITNFFEKHNMSTNNCVGKNLLSKIRENMVELTSAKSHKQDLVLSYYDSPNNVEPISNKYFINILGSAEKYAYFYTPYLIIGESLKEAFIQAAQRGVDVRIIIPGIPDKKMVYLLTKKYAEELSDYGVKVYIYDKGFVHAKASIVDDRICSVGTTNLDFRSLYLHFENNTLFTGKEFISQIKDDFLSVQSDSVLLTAGKKNIFKKLFLTILDIFSPFL